MVASPAISGHVASDTSVNGLYGSASAEVVRKAVDSVAAPHAVQRGSGSNAPATLPSGERGEYEGQSPSPLDKHANNVSPPARPVEHFKVKRHRLRRISGALLPQERVANCGRKPLGGIVLLHECGGSHYYGNLETCGSVWTCPVCAVKISERRKADIQSVLEAQHAEGGQAYMMTLTIPHHRMQSCKELRQAVAACWRYVKGGSPWYRAKASYGYLGDVRALEVTHGGNGWHPHLHVLVFLKPGTCEAKAEALGSWFFDRWARAIARRGFGECSNDAFTFDLVTPESGAADYVGKWGAVSCELTKAHLKSGRSGRTPWQILSDCEAGDPRDKALFREYARAFKGARWLTWAGDIRSLYLLDEEALDEELAAELPEPRQHVATFDASLWWVIYRRHLTAEVQIAADTGGLEAVLAVFRSSGIRFDVELKPSPEGDGLAPMFTLNGM